jgi:hypothetical protein
MIPPRAAGGGRQRHLALWSAIRVVAPRIRHRTSAVSIPPTINALARAENLIRPVQAACWYSWRA